MKRIYEGGGRSTENLYHGVTREELLNGFISSKKKKKGQNRRQIPQRITIYQK